MIEIPETTSKRLNKQLTPPPQKNSLCMPLEYHAPLFIYYIRTHAHPWLHSAHHTPYYKYG